jgi:hypothetical protein
VPAEPQKRPTFFAATHEGSCTRSGALCAALGGMLRELSHSGLLGAGAPSGNASFVQTPTAVVIGSLSACFATISTVWLIVRHLQFFSRPELQLPIARMVFLVPVYAVASVFSLAIPSAALWFGTIRDVYEAYAVYLFFVLICDFAGGESAVASAWGSRSSASVRHIWPASYCTAPIPLDPAFLRFCRRMMVQFVIVKLVAAVLSLILLAAGVFHEDGVQWVLFTVYTVSYTAALYYLFLFYLGIREQLRGLRPAAKFFVLKATVFATYYIALALRGIDTSGTPELWDAFITSLFMGLLSPAFWCAFGTQDFMVGGAASVSIANAQAAAVSGRDWRVVCGRVWLVLDCAHFCQDAVNQFSSERSTYLQHGDTEEAIEARAVASRGKSHLLSDSPYHDGGMMDASGDMDALTDDDDGMGDIADGGADAWAAGDETRAASKTVTAGVSSASSLRATSRGHGASRGGYGTSKGPR